MIVTRKRLFSSSTKPPASMLDLDQATKHCTDHVKKFDYYAWRVGTHYPKHVQASYYGLNAFFLEVLKSREISRENSIVQTRLNWWAQTVKDIDAGKPAREPVARMLQEVREKTQVNLKLLHRMVDFQLFDIERGQI